MDLTREVIREHLRQTQWGTIPEGGTIRATKYNLREHGFSACIDGHGITCPRAKHIRPHRDQHASALFCQEAGREISTEGASSCDGPKKIPYSAKQATF